MKTKALLTSVLTISITSLSGCASSGANHTPIIDAPKTAQYQADLEACRTLAGESEIINDETKGATALGAALGGISGLSHNRRYGRKSDGNNVLAGALVGAALGGGIGVYGGYKKQKNILTRCMTGRGYHVLG